MLVPIAWNLHTRFPPCRDCFIVELLKLLDIDRIQEIKTVTESDDRSNYGRLIVLLEFSRPPPRLFGSIVPKVNPGAEPIVIVVAWLEWLTIDQSFCRRSSCPMIANDCPVIIVKTHSLSRSVDWHPTHSAPGVPDLQYRVLNSLPDSSNTMFLR